MNYGILTTTVPHTFGYFNAFSQDEKKKPVVHAHIQHKCSWWSLNPLYIFTSQYARVWRKCFTHYKLQFCELAIIRYCFSKSIFANNKLVLNGFFWWHRRFNQISFDKRINFKLKKSPMCSCHWLGISKGVKVKWFMFW